MASHAFGVQHRGQLGALMRRERGCHCDTQLSIFQNRLSDAVREMTQIQHDNARLVQN
jgi:hypothetical protein